MLHEVLKHKNTQRKLLSGNNQKIVELLNEIMAFYSLDSSITNKDNKTIISLLKESNLPNELKEKLTLSNIEIGKKEKNKLNLGVS